VVTDFTLPELGENVTSGDVLRVLVKPGDTIEKEQSVLELETDKATIEVPSSVAGQVKEVKVKAGDKVSVGQAILTVEAPTDAGGTPKQGTGGQSRRQASGGTPQAEAQSVVGAHTAEGVPGDSGLEPHADGPKRPPATEKSKVVDISRGARPAPEPARSELPVAPATPSVRRMARELGVDVNQVAGSGPSGRISVDDVKAHAKRLVSGSAKGSDTQAAAEPLPDFTRWGEIERRAMRAVRRKTAERVSLSWATVAHVTQHDLADVTRLDQLRKRYAKQAQDAGGNLTVTAVAVKVVAAALKVFPQLNTSIDVAAGEIIYKKYVNIGVAVDTDRGLLVPVIRDADTKNILQISIELVQLSEKARTRKLSLEEMQGGTFSISNLGGIGGTYFTPIVNAPEVAILGISRGSIQPKFENGQFVPRMMLPLSLSYDHRAIDGADAIRFLRWVVSAFEEPFVIALSG
jgi:pyruvate dehydrogenase E2 component (dihydrolipoamide acetyltransferase)